MKKTFFKITLILGLFSLTAQAKTIYVATNGNDANSGSFSAPLASVMKAQEKIAPGDTVLIRSGIYRIKPTQIAAQKGIYTLVHDLNKSGSPHKRLHYMAYPGEKVLFDLSDVKPDKQRVIAFNVTGSWIHLKGFEVVGTQVTITGHTQSECFHNEGSNNVYEQLAMHDGQAIGFYLTKGSDNLILNCDAYHNWDYTSEGGNGGNADGFGCHPQQGSTGNLFRGCRAWFNSDDGYDCIRAYEAVVFENCWAFYNGYNDQFKSLADGNGFKAGGWGLAKDKRMPDVIPMHTVRFCLAVGNKQSGFYANHHPGGGYWYNNSAYRNNINFNMLGRNLEFTKDIPGVGHVLKNNLSFEARTADTKWIDLEKCTVENNSFLSKLSLEKSDFESLDEKELAASRKADGRLPDIRFIHPKSSSRLLKEGTKDQGLFKDGTPFWGAFN
jgi:Right handed beta helix region